MAKRIARWAVLLGLASLLPGCKGCNNTNLGRCGFTWFETLFVSASSAPQNSPANGLSGAPSASTDGRFIAFGSMASNLVSPATPANNELVYLRDTCGGSAAPAGCQPKTILVSSNSSGQAPTGCFGSPQLNFRPGISGDGRYIVFESSTCSLGFGGNETGTWQIYVRDTCTGPNGPATLAGCVPNTIQLTSSAIASRHPTISTDGLYVAFKSNATDLPPDRQGKAPAGSQIYVGDISQCERPTGIRSCAPNIVLVSQDATGAQANSGTVGSGDTDSPQISPAGRFVVFTSRNKNLGAGGAFNSPMQVFVADSCVSGGSFVGACTVQTYGPFSASGGGLANADAIAPTIDNSGRFLAFASSATNLATNVSSGTSQIYFVDDCTVPSPQGNCTMSLKVVSVAVDGTPGNAMSSAPFLASNGAAVVFESLATNFVQEGTVSGGDVFVTSTCPGNPSGCVSTGVGLSTSDCKVPNGAISQPVFDVNADTIAFTSAATNLDPSASVIGVFLGKTGQ